MLLMIDNYDSFTFNLVHYFQHLGEEVNVVRNDEVTLAEIQAMKPDHIVISPGPCDPQQAGLSLAIIEHFKATTPILGVCLGHQCIAEHFGGKVIRAKQVMHGKTSLIKHNNDGMFKGLNNPLQVTRYHSLVVDKSCLPDCLEILAWSESSDAKFEEIMGLKHITLPVMGVQFHPESILTEQGHQLLANFLTLTA